MVEFGGEGGRVGPNEFERLTDAVERLIGVIDRDRTSNNGGTTQQSSSGRGNGGQPAPTHSAGPATPGREMLWGTPGTGAHAAEATKWGSGQNGGQATFGQAMYQRAGGASGIAAGVATAGLVSAATYTANHYGNQVLGQSIASQWAGGPNWSQAYRQGIMNNFSAASDADAFQAANAMGQFGGAVMGSSQYNRAFAQTKATTALNPYLTQAQVVGTQNALAAPGTFNRMSALGINTMAAGTNTGDPMAVAQQLVQRIGGSKAKTAQQVAAAFGPSGGATITVNQMVANGSLPAESAPVILANMRSIMEAQNAGMSMQELSYASTMASTNPNSKQGKKAVEALRQAGISGFDTSVQRIRENEGRSRESEGKTIEGFTQGLEHATEILGQFRDVLNGILSIPGVGAMAGYGSGIMGTLPAIGSLLSKIPGGNIVQSGLGALIGGDGPASMSAGAMMYGGAAGGPTTAARGGGGGGSTGSSRSTSSYSLGPVKPWVSRAAEVLGKKFGIGTIYGYGQRSGVSDHPKGLALDLMCGKTAGDRLAAFAVANYKALNITYVIWRQRIWSISNRSWRGMEDRGSVTANHYDHVHISFLASPNNPDLGGLRGGGGASLGSGGGGGGAGGVGTSTTDNGGSAFMNTAAGGSSGSTWGGFSEVAALGLGGGSSAGGFGGSAGSGEDLSDSTGGGGGGTGGGGVGFGGVAGLNKVGGSVRSGSFNVNSRSSAASSQRALSSLFNRADVLSLSEMSNRKKNLRGWIGKQGWGMYQQRDDTAVVWDKDDYRMVRSGTKRLNTSRLNGRPATGPRDAAYVLLEDKKTGSRFWQIAAHTIPAIDRPGAGAARMKIAREQFGALTSLYNDLAKTGYPVVMAGDFNTHNPGKLLGGDLRSAWGAGKSKYIDHTVYDPDLLKQLGNSAIRGLGGSPHPAVLTNLKFAGSRGGGGSGGGNGGTPAQNMALARSLLDNYGFGQGQWAALKNLWMRESGWRTNADNPSSSAYGIPQAMTSIHSMPKGYMSDPAVQIKWGLNYIKQRYGSPANAWNFWQRNNWYDSGAWNLSQDHDARVHKGEMILPSKIADVVRDELTSPGIRNILGGSRSGGGGPQIIIHPGAVVIKVSGNVTEKAMRDAGEQFIDAIKQYDRYDTLTVGGA